jgi:hypothetical protein
MMPMSLGPDRFHSLDFGLHKLPGGVHRAQAELHGYILRAYPNNSFGVLE